MRQWHIHLAICGVLALSACGTTMGTGVGGDAESGTDAILSDDAGTDATVSDVGTDATAGTDAATTDVASGTDAQADVQPDSAPDAVLDSSSDAITPSGCGGKTSIACPDGQYCAVADGQCGAIGSCKVKPQICPMIVMPVCGCDGKTYNNSCEAEAQGVNVASNAACATDNTCGGFAGKPCGKSQFCDLSSCGADVMGTCVAIPVGCPKNLAPVCGCDGKTYGNDCMRQAAGIAKSSDGNCPTSGCTTTKDCPSGLACKSGTCGTCMGIMCTAIACPPNQVKDQCCQCYTP